MANNEIIEMKPRIWFDPAYHRLFQISLFAVGENNVQDQIVTEIKTENYKEGTKLNSWFLSQQSAQCIIDDLFRAGLRPNGLMTTGHQSALEKHLDDMRQLVFGRKKK
jgi:hypothetical protein